jgi:EAL domain-containing protein (putative c-di-GMP-specific phosphodiesterase class I)
LMRWRHPVFGLLAPGMFHKAMKPNTVTTIDLGYWSIEQAIKQIDCWQKDGLLIPVSVNVMASELVDDNFCGWLDALFMQYSKVSKSMLELEIVESSLLSNPLRLVEVVTECRAAGIKVSLDDFGTGYSSLSHVKIVPSDYVKIDQMFVKDIIHNYQDRGMVSMVIALARNYDRQVIAEGVESIEHGLVLLELGCKLAQGYAIARPMPANDVIAWVNGYKGQPEWIGVGDAVDESSCDHECRRCSQNPLEINCAIQ